MREIRPSGLEGGGAVTPLSLPLSLVAACPRCAVSQVFNLPYVAREPRSADYKSPLRQIKNLRYDKHIRRGDAG